MKKIVLFTFLLFLSFNFAKAQVNSYPFAQALDTFQLINGTVVDMPAEDDAFHANLPIGFNFVYNGTATDKFGVCTNGFIVMDSLSHAANWFLSGSTKNQICVATHDLKNTNSGGTIEYVTVGTAPNRALIIQWKDYGVFGMNYCHLNFQIRLFEGSNCVAFYYGANGTSGSNQTFSVGLVGDTISDFNLRTTANDWTNSSNSLTYPGSGMHMGSVSILPSGLVYAFGNCPSTGLHFSYLTGKVYNDINGNGTQDPGENGLQNILVHESLLNTFVNTDTGGNYALFYIDSTLTYSLNCTPYTYWTQTSLPVVHSVNPATQSAANLNFGLQATPNVHDVAITSWSSNLPWPNGTVHFTTSYHNIGTVAESDTIFFTMDPHYIYQSAIPAPSNISGNNMYWLYSNLQPLEYRNLTMTLKADTTITQGDTLFSFWMINPFNADVDQNNNRYDHAQVCLSSFDPNEKSVSPEGTISTTTPLEYTIKFQNTGTAAALNIFVHDQLDANLDASTFEVKGFSHPMTYTLNGTGNLVFTFAGINLPDSNSNEPQSHGYIRYSILPKNNLSDGTTINNTASIYFDFNAPVVTNTTQNTIGNSSTGITQSAETNNALVVYPNPAGNEIKLLNEGFRYQTITITDITGRTMQHVVAGKQETIRLSVSSLSKGLYFIKAETTTGSFETVSFVKE